jgi:hypothetical protein
MQGGATEEGAAPLPMAQHMLTRQHGGARSVSAAPLRVTRMWLVRRRAEWCRTFELGLPSQARAGLLPHFLPHLLLCGGCSLSLSQSSHPKPLKSKLFSVDFAFPKSPKVLSIISLLFDPLEFAYLVLNPQILETLEILIHQNCNVDSC